MRSAKDKEGEKKKKRNELTKYARRISSTREITHIDRSILVAQRQQPGQATPSINIPTLCESEKLHHISRPLPFRKIAFLLLRFDGALRCPPYEGNRDEGIRRAVL